MFTYDVVSESVKTPHELAAELTRRSAAGWEVVEIVYDGEHWFHAFLRHHGQVDIAPYVTAVPSAGSPAAEAAARAAATPSSAANAGMWQSAASDSERVQGLRNPGGRLVNAQPQGTPQTDASVPSVPANWYKDPSGRFEMRYWNGTQWTEHVATAGKQSIDPPKQ